MFQRRLNKTRKERGITAQQMADALNINIRAYRKYESKSTVKTGHTLPPIPNLIKIADILDVSTDWLLCRDEWLKSHGVPFD